MMGSQKKTFETNYFYDEGGRLNRVVDTEVIDNYTGSGVDSGELLTSETCIENDFTATLAVMAVIMSAIGIGVGIAQLLRTK